MTYDVKERERQVALRMAGDLFPLSKGRDGKINGRVYPFALAERDENLMPSLRVWARSYVNKHDIVKHRMYMHLLSSQVCCVNFLAPFANDPVALAALVRPLFPSSSAVRPLPIPGEDGYVAFEWSPKTDLLNETDGKPPPRGAHATSTDAALHLEVDGRRELVLIEWKYTEKYARAPLSGGETARVTREQRYGNLAFAPGGPIRSDLGLKLTDFFAEPAYQLLRQQMLAYRVERVGDEERRFDRAWVLHVSPRGNTALRKPTAARLAEMGDDLLALWPTLLERPDRFRSVATEELFGRFDWNAHGAAVGMAGAYLRRRYAFAFE
ncbi:MAG TPA: hypothetical protein VD929_11445 [Caulobacteraceae bacterium]|nr:hypothetical protein [Caulobacteraceae bacterium]